MNFVTKNIQWVMLLSGALTSTMFYGLFAPEAALESMFGKSFSGTLESMVVRSWSALIGLVGVMLLYGAYREKHRVFAIATLSKAIFVALVLLYGTEYLAKAAPAIAMDCIVVVLGVVYLATVSLKPSIAQA